MTPVPLVSLEDGKQDEMKDLILGYATNCKFRRLLPICEVGSPLLPSRRGGHCDFSHVQGPKFSALVIAEGITLVPSANVWKMSRDSKPLNYQLHL